MAAGNWKVYGPFVEAVSGGGIDLDNDSFRLALVTSGYTPDQGAHDTWSDISTNEVANGDGYATHGEALTVTVSRDGLTVTVDAEDVTWTESTITAKYAVIVRDADDNGALASTDLVVAFVDLNTGGGSGSSDNGDFTVGFHANGAFRFIAD